MVANNKKNIKCCLNLFLVKLKLGAHAMHGISFSLRKPSIQKCLVTSQEFYFFQCHVKRKGIASHTFRQVQLQSINIQRYCYPGVLQTSNSIELHLSPLQIAIIVYKNVTTSLEKHDCIIKLNLLLCLQVQQNLEVYYNFKRNGLVLNLCFRCKF